MPPQFVAYNPTAVEIVAHLRTEPIVRRPDYEFTVRANVHDALWMLTQQWRVGEFRGEDAGTVVKAKIETQTTLLNRFKSRNGPVEPLPTAVPLEAKVERLPLPLDFGLGLRIAQQWSRLLRGAGLGTSYDALFAEVFPIDTESADTPEQQSNARAMQMRQALAGRLMDGIAFWNAIYNTPASETDGIAAADQGAIDAAQDQLIAWFERVYYQPSSPEENSWSPTQLEYQFAVSAPDSGLVNSPQTVFRADRYQLGKLDWYAVDIDPNPSATLSEVPSNPIDNHVQEDIHVESYLPHTIRFKGMPRGRWWEFEDQNIDLAKMMVQKQDIVKMVVLEFGIIYSNDWFVFPHRVNSGSITAVNGLVTTDVFGRKFVIERAGTGLDDDWQRWDMYNISKQGISTSDLTYNKLLLMPTVVNRQEGEPTEKVLFLRDEMANMAWGVEEIVSDELMGGKSGRKAADELQAYLLKDHIPPTVGEYIANEAKLRYKITTSVPENWIPFVAARGPNTDREIMFQRAAQSRYLDANSAPQIIVPRTEILSVGLDANQPYFINEEEVSRSGFVLTSGFKRTRWYNGETFTWLGRKVASGRGEGASGLRFDMLEDKEADLLMPIPPAPMPPAGALAWWSADHPQNTIIGGQYETLYDGSSKGNHISAYDGSTRPTVLQNWRNGKPAVQFNGAQAMRLAMLNLPAGTSDFTVFMVGKKTSINVSIMLELSDSINVNTGWAFINNELSLDHVVIRKYDYNAHGISNTTTLNVPGTYVFAANLSDQDPETSVEFNDQMYLNPLAQADNVGDFSSEPFNLGSRAGQELFSHFELAELIVYPFKMDNTQRTAAKEYLKEKYDMMADPPIPMPPAGALAWWSADHPQNTIIGGQYETLYDGSGKENHISAYNGSTRPTVLQNWRNGKPSIKFNGGQAMRLPVLNLPANTSDFTIFLVGEKTNNNTGIVLELSDNVNAYTGWTFVMNENNLDHMAIVAVPNSAYNVHGAPSNLTLGISGIYALSANLSDADPETSVEFKDTLYTTPLPLTQTDNTGHFLSAPFNIGNRAGQNVFAYFNIAELIIYPFKCSAAQRLAVKSYLKVKYGF